MSSVPTLGGVGDGVHGIPLVAQRERKGRADSVIVLDDQDLLGHVPIVPREGSPDLLWMLCHTTSMELTRVRNLDPSR